MSVLVHMRNENRIPDSSPIHHAELEVFSWDPLHVRSSSIDVRCRLKVLQQELSVSYNHKQDEISNWKKLQEIKGTERSKI